MSAASLLALYTTLFFVLLSARLCLMLDTHAATLSFFRLDAASAPRYTILRCRRRLQRYALCHTLAVYAL